MARLKGFKKLTPVEKALKTFFEHLNIHKPKAALVSLDMALNRVLAEPITAEEDLPRFDKSAVDGYAVRAEDTVGASQFKPVMLEITQNAAIGKKQAKQVWTGAKLPKGANAVLMLENTRHEGNKLEVWTAVASGENVSKRGEDIKKGETVLKAGVRLKPQHLGMIAALGKATVKVFEKPKIAILTTGNELVRVGEKPRENQIFDTNSHMISALCRELGADVLDLGITRDMVDEIIGKLEFGLKKADALICTGGTSVGGLDLVPEAVNKIGKPGVIVHGIAMRPAMPTALAIINEKPVLILSGNPVAAFFGFEVFGRPLLGKLCGMEREEPRPSTIAKLVKKTTSALGRKTFVRVRVFYENGELFAEPISSRGSGLVSTLTKSNGYVVVPENREGLEEGEMVTVSLFDVLEERF